jgi:hypothetical protein
VNWLKLAIMQTETLTCKRVQELSGENDGMTIYGAVGKFRKHTIIAQHEVAVVIGQYKDKECDETKQVYLPVYPACSASCIMSNISIPVSNCHL